MKAIIDDYLFRETPPYLDGKPDHVYWAHIGSKKFYCSDNVWVYLEVGPGRSDTINDTQIIAALEAARKEYVEVHHNE